MNVFCSLNQGRERAGEAQHPRQGEHSNPFRKCPGARGGPPVLEVCELLGCYEEPDLQGSRGVTASASTAVPWPAWSRSAAPDSAAARSVQAAAQSVQAVLALSVPVCPWDLAAAAPPSEVPWLAVPARRTRGCHSPATPPGHPHEQRTHNSPLLCAAEKRLTALPSAAAAWSRAPSSSGTWPR